MKQKTHLLLFVSKSECKRESIGIFFNSTKYFFTFTTSFCATGYRFTKAITQTVKLRNNFQLANFKTTDHVIKKLKGIVQENMNEA